MRCLKCGDKTGYHQVFCEKCMSHMAQYPVDKDAHAALPDRKKYAVKKVRPPKPEEVIADLQKANRIQKKTIRILRLTILLVLLIAALLVWYGLQYGYIQSPAFIPFGWNRPA